MNTFARWLSKSSMGCDFEDEASFELSLIEAVPAPVTESMSGIAILVMMLTERC